MRCANNPRSPLTAETCMAKGPHPRAHFAGNYLHHYSAAGTSAVAHAAVRKHIVARSRNALHRLCEQRMRNDLRDDINTRVSQTIAMPQLLMSTQHPTRPASRRWDYFFCFIPMGGACSTYTTMLRFQLRLPIICLSVESYRFARRPFASERKSLLNLKK